MALNYVLIHYGPSHTCNDVSYKPERLAGLKDRLQKLCYRVDFHQVNFEDYCLLEMCGHEVFRCNLKNLMFNTPYYLDPVCKRAVAAVQDATSKFIRARNYLWFWSTLQERVFRLGHLCITEHFPQRFDTKVETFASVDKCQQCCGILTTNRAVNK